MIRRASTVLCCRKVALPAAVLDVRLEPLDRAAEAVRAAGRARCKDAVRKGAGVLVEESNVQRVDAPVTICEQHLHFI